MDFVTGRKERESSTFQSLFPQSNGDSSLRRKLRNELKVKKPIAHSPDKCISIKMGKINGNIKGQ